MLVPVAAQLGIAPLHFGVVLVVAMGIGLFAPPLGLGLYGACLIGNVPIESTVKPILAYLGLLTAVLLFHCICAGPDIVVAAGARVLIMSPYLTLACGVCGAHFLAEKRLLANTASHAG